MKDVTPERRLVKLKLFCELTGYTPAAVQGKIRHGVWQEGVHFHRAPDGHLFIDMGEFEKWVAKQK